MDSNDANPKIARMYMSFNLLSLLIPKPSLCRITGISKFDKDGVEFLVEWPNLESEGNEPPLLYPVYATERSGPYHYFIRFDRPDESE